jgi:single-stranded-DNA-specific exonuclease
MRTWIEPEPVTVPEDLQTAVGGHPIISRVLLRRGIDEPSKAFTFLDPSNYRPSPPTELPDISQAVQRISQAIQHGELICVWGDFDVDGQTATTLLVSALQELGARVFHHIPVRAHESHGVNLPALRQVLARGTTLLLTCDTGIGANEALAFAMAQNVDVVVTDHHELPVDLPPALALINPRFLPSHHPLATLSGVGVAFKLVEELFSRFARTDEIEQYLDLVALGLIADLALQTGDTRYLIQRGLQVLRETPRLGLRLMIEYAELSLSCLTEGHVGYMLAPRLNAIGRLDDANPVVEFLTTRDPARARVLANHLEALNARRKLLTDQVFQGALAQIEHDPSILNDPVLVLSNPYWPAGVIGIVASRLVERFNRPTVLISTPSGGLANGSARSVPEINITSAIATQRELLAGFGGHPMAAGLSLAPEHIPELRQGLAQSIRTLFGDINTEPKLQIDEYMPLDDLNLEFVEDLERLAPFGPGNPPLILACRGLTLKSHSTIGRHAEHLQLIVEDDEGRTHKMIWWQGAGWELPESRFDLAYTVRASDYHGSREVQIEWVDARPVRETIVLEKPPRRMVEWVDFRKQDHPLDWLKRVQDIDEIQIWCEAEARQKIGGHSRQEIVSSKILAIWTTPPGQQELDAVLEVASPEKVYLFSVDPEASTLDSFIKRLAGLVKYALRVNQGITSLTALAGATAQRLVTVRLGLEWLAQHGILTILTMDGETIQLGTSDRTHKSIEGEITNQLKDILNETAAYRAYYASAEPTGLLGFNPD